MNKNMIDGDHTELLNAALVDESNRSLAIAVIAFTGARPNEIISLTHRQLTFVSGECKIKINASKRGDSRWITLPDELYARLKILQEKLIELNKPFAILIGDCSMRVRTAYELIRQHFNKLQINLWGEQRYTLKSWRHSLAIRALKSGMDIMHVKKILGHKALASTVHYLADYEKDIVLDKLHLLVRGTV